MTGVVELGPPGVEVDAQQLPGGVAAVVVGQVGLLGEAGSCAAGAAQGAHQHGGGQGGVDVVAHGIGH